MDHPKDYRVLNTLYFWRYVFNNDLRKFPEKNDMS